MNDKIKLSVYLDNYQYRKLCSVASSLHKSPEQVANNVVTGYLSMVDPVPPDVELETVKE